MMSTAQLRSAWAPSCQGPWATVALYGKGKVSVRPTIVEAVKALDACLRTHNYRTRQADTGAYNCRVIASSGNKSLHSYGIALDINWQTNPFLRRLTTDMPKAMRTAILAIRTNNGKQVWGWGGNYAGSKDAMHWEIVCRPSDLAHGIDRSTVPSWSTPMRPAPTSEPTPKPPAPKPKPQEEDDMVVIDKKSRAVIVLTKTHWRNVNKNRDHYIGMAELTHTKIPEWTDTQIKAWIKSESLIELPPA